MAKNIKYAKNGTKKQRDLTAAEMQELEQITAENEISGKKRAALAALEDIDRRAARHVRALLLDKTDAEAVERLRALELEAVPLRDRLRPLLVDKEAPPADPPER